MFRLLLLVVLFLAQTASGEETLVGRIEERLQEFYPNAVAMVRGLKGVDPSVDSVPEEIVVLDAGPDRATLLLRYGNGKSKEVKAHLQTLQRVVLSRRYIRRGEVLKASDLYIGLKRSSRIPADAVHTLKEAVGKVMKRTVAANRVITESMLLDSVLIKKGKRILIVVETDAFRITAPGKLMQTAAVGEFVRVLNLSTKKTLKGILLDAHTVKVIL